MSKYQTFQLSGCSDQYLIMFCSDFKFRIWNNETKSYLPGDWRTESQVKTHLKSLLDSRIKKYDELDLFSNTS